MIIFLFFSFIFDFLAVILSFVQSQSKFVLSLFLLLLNHLFFLYHVFLIRYSFFFSFISLSCLIQFFQSFVFANFSLLFIWNIVPLWYRSSFLFYFYLFCISISQSCYFIFSLFHSFKTCSYSQREIRTNMHDKGTKRNVNANEASLC